MSPPPQKHLRVLREANRRSLQILSGSRGILEQNNPKNHATENHLEHSNKREISTSRETKSWWGVGSSANLAEQGSSRFLVTGALGQIGIELVPYLRSRFGCENVIASDIKLPSHDYGLSGPFQHADVRNPDSLASVIQEERVDCIIHLASLLSASGEKNPQMALDVNIRSIQNVLELSRMFGLRVFAPSSIAVFGPSTPKDYTPDTTILEPTTIYGITKVHLELLGHYYRQTHGVDFRSLRFPGIVSAHSMPGGGTTDYAVDIFHSALKTGTYTCFLERNQALPMMYMPDCIQATVQLLRANPQALTRSVYYVTAMSFTPQQLASEIKHYIPNFSVAYKPDFRQKIASSWPRSVNDDIARHDWAWEHSYNLQAMTLHMLQALAPQYLGHEEMQVALTV